MKRRRAPLTETDKLKEAQATAARMSTFIDQEIERWGKGHIDRPMLCCGIETWLSAMREVFRVEDNQRWAKIKKEGDQLEREAFNRMVIENDIC